MKRDRPAMIVGPFLALALSLLAPPVHGQEPSQEQKAVTRALEQGRQRLDAGDYSAARRSFEKARDASNGRSPLAFLGLAETEFSLGNVEKALEFVEGALALTRGPMSRAHMTNFKGLIHFEIYRKLGIQKAATTAPGAHGEGRVSVTEIPTELAFTDSTPEQRAQMKAAEASFREALELSGRSLNVARLNLAKALEEQNRDEEALVVTRVALENATTEEERSEAGAWMCLFERAREISRRLEAAAGEAKRVTPPVRIFEPTPAYPKSAQKAGAQGVVIIKAIIDEKGEVQCARVTSGLSHGINESALEAFQRWRFEPAKLDGEPVPVYYCLSINFQL